MSNYQIRIGKWGLCVGKISLSLGPVEIEGIFVVVVMVVFSNQSSQQDPGYD